MGNCSAAAYTTACATNFLTAPAPPMLLCRHCRACLHEGHACIGRTLLADTTDSSQERPSTCPPSYLLVLLCAVDMLLHHTITPRTLRGGRVPPGGTDTAAGMLALTLGGRLLPFTGMSMVLPPATLPGLLPSPARLGPPRSKRCADVKPSILAAVWTSPCRSPALPVVGRLCLSPPGICGMPLGSMAALEVEAYCLSCDMCTA
mmetsp:Transcript_37334/g.83070  ORF Transcript_37334/g.83070 Transcript_37334/m.83070 type:complete len:204 (+) Transcript_37334:1424-2035(+)